MKKNEIFIILGIILYFVSKIIDWFIWDIPNIGEIIIYIASIIFLVSGYLFDKALMRTIKNLSSWQKVSYLLLIFINIVILGFIDIVSNIILIILYLGINYFLGSLIYKYVK